VNSLDFFHIRMPIIAMNSVSSTPSPDRAALRYENDLRAADQAISIAIHLAERAGLTDVYDDLLAAKQIVSARYRAVQRG
jgi:hypothetical protein